MWQIQNIWGMTNFSISNIRQGKGEVSEAGVRASTQKSPVLCPVWASERIQQIGVIVCIILQQNSGTHKAKKTYEITHTKGT